MQCFGRMVIAKYWRNELYWQNLSRNASEVRRVLAQDQLEKIEAEAKTNIQSGPGNAPKQQARNGVLVHAAELAPKENVRAKVAPRACARGRAAAPVERGRPRRYEFADANLKTMKHAQEVFADAEGRIERATMGQPFVVEETETVIDVGNTEEYDVEFTEEMGLAIGLKKHAASEITFVHSVPKSLGPESTTKPGHREWKQAKVQIESQLVAINDYPVSSLTHEQVMSRLKKIEWPLRMRFRRPLRPEDVAPDTAFEPIDFCREAHQRLGGGGDDDVKLQMLKRLLAAGLKLKKHDAGGFTDPSFETTLYINEHMIFWERSDLESKVRKVGDVVNKKRKTKFEARESAKSKDSDDYSGVAKFEPVDPTKPLFEEKGGAQEKEGLQGNWQLHLSRKYDCTDGMSLYDLKYVRAGKVSSTLKGKSKRTKTRAFHSSSRVPVARSTLSTSSTQNIVRAGATRPSSARVGREGAGGSQPARLGLQQNYHRGARFEALPRQGWKPIATRRAEEEIEKS